MSAVHDSAIAGLAESLRRAQDSRQPVAPLREHALRLGLHCEPGQAYAIQRVNRQHRAAGGDRVVGRKIGLFDTIADNASAAGFVLGADPVRLTDLKLREARMTMMRGTTPDDTQDGHTRDAATPVSTGVGSACLGHPLNAAAWLARTLSRMGEPLRAGDIVLTGALGPMVPARAGEHFEARIEGLGAVSVRFA